MGGIPCKYRQGIDSYSVALRDFSLTNTSYLILNFKIKQFIGRYLQKNRSLAYY